MHIVPPNHALERARPIELLLVVPRPQRLFTARSMRLVKMKLFVLV
jgi:hypothetical protein